MATFAGWSSLTIDRRTLLAARRVSRQTRLVLGGGIILLVVLVAIFGPLLWRMSASELLVQPLQGPSLAHPLGADELGRDELARLLLGARVSLLVALIAVSLGLVVGTLIGLPSGYFAGKLDAVLMRIMDGLLAFPAILLAIMIAAALGPGLVNAMIAVGIVSVPAFARLARSQALKIRQQDYISAAYISGVREAWIVVTHVLPNSISPIIVFTATSTAHAILTEATLAFLGLGAAPPTPDWGAMLQTGFSYVSLNVWLTVLPGSAIAMTTLGFIFLGDGLRDWLDPRTG